MSREIRALTTPEGVLALRAMEKKLATAQIDLVQAAKDMKTVIDGEIEALGPYKQSYQNMVAFASVATTDASGDIETLRSILTKKADRIADWLAQGKPAGVFPTASTGASSSGDDSAPPPPEKVKKKVR